MPPKKQYDQHVVQANMGPKLTEDDDPQATGPKLRLGDYPEVQKDELEVLQSIYLEDFEEVQGKPSAWGVREGRIGKSRAVWY